MVKMQYVHPEIVSAEGFEETATANVFVTQNGDVAILDGNQAILIRPDQETAKVVRRENFKKQYSAENLEKELWPRILLALSEDPNPEIFNDGVRQYLKKLTE